MSACIHAVCWCEPSYASIVDCHSLQGMADAKEAQLRQAPLVVVRLCTGDSNIHVRISLQLADACGVPAEHVLDYVVPIVDEQPVARREKRLKPAQGQPEAQHIWVENPSHNWDKTGHKLMSSATIAITTQVKAYGSSHHSCQRAKGVAEMFCNQQLLLLPA